MATIDILQLSHPTDGVHLAPEKERPATRAANAARVKLGRHHWSRIHGAAEQSVWDCRQITAAGWTRSRSWTISIHFVAGAGGLIPPARVRQAVWALCGNFQFGRTKWQV